MKGKENFLKTIQKDKKYLGIGLFLLFISIFLVLIFSLSMEDEKDAKEIKKIKKDNVYAKIDVSVMTDYFATNDYSGSEHKTYFVWDDQYVYIVDLNDKTRNQLQEIYDYSYSEEEWLIAPSSVTIKGMTKTIPDDLKEIAICSLNEIIGKQVVDSTNFDQTFGFVYLDTYESPVTYFLSELLICLLPFVFGLLFLIFYFKRKYAVKKCIHLLNEKWEILLKEMDNPDTIYFQKVKLYMTQNYLVSCLNGLEIYPYQEIIWIYPHEYRYNGVVVQKSLLVITKTAKSHKLALLNATKKNLKLYDDIYNTLLNHIPGVLSGYTKENKERAKELCEKN